MDPLNYFNNNRWEYLFSRETGIKELFHPGPYSLRYDHNGNELVNADCREANGLLYTGTDDLHTKKIFGEGEYELSFDSSVTGVSISFWIFYHENRIEQNKASFPGYGFEVKISRDGHLSIIDHYKDKKIECSIDTIENTHCITLNVIAMVNNGSYELFFYINKNLILRYSTDIFNQSKIRIKGGIYQYIKFRGEYKLSCNTVRG